MRDREQHLTDQELLLDADDESTRWARTHLASCLQCRSRAAEFESTIAQLSREQKDSIDSQLPSIAGPRAALRARMAEVTRREAGVSSGPWIPSRLFAGAMGVAALAVVVAAAGFLAFRHENPRGEFPAPLSSDAGVLPNRDFTPGAARLASLEEICSLPHEEVVKEVSPGRRQQVLAEYGIPAAQASEYEVDYLITPGLGGNDDLRNLWPEPYHAAAWNAHVKDALEERLHEMVCAHQIGLGAAQQAIASNWIAAYLKYVQPSPAKTRMDGASPLKADLRSIVFTNEIASARSPWILKRRYPALPERARRRMRWLPNAAS